MDRWKKRMRLFEFGRSFEILYSTFLTSFFDITATSCFPRTGGRVRTSADFSS